VQALVLATLFSIILAVIGAIFAADLLRLMGAAPEVIATGTNFTRVMLGGSTTVFLLFMINACFRGAGDAAIAMRVLWFANALNIILGPLLIFGVGPFPKLGVTGAAVVFALSRLVKGHGALEIQRRHLLIDVDTMKKMLRLAGNGTFQVLVGSLNWIGLVRLMSSFGSTAMAGYTIAIRLVIFALLPAWGLSNAAATLVGQSLGAGNPERAEQSVWTAARYNLVFLGGMGLLFIAIAPWIVSAFTTDAEIARVATFGLRTIAAGFPFFAFGMVFTQAFNGAGDTVTPTWINIGVFWLFEVPLAWVLAEHTPLGLNGIFLSVLAAYSLLAAVSALLFRRGKWKLRRV
jgi:putative MATE family efflux protein